MRSFMNYLITVLLYVSCSLPFLTAGLLALAGLPGWGWFLFVGVIVMLSMDVSINIHEHYGNKEQNGDRDNDKIQTQRTPQDGGIQ